MPLRLLLDTAVHRAIRTPLMIKEDGRTWQIFNNTFLDPITYSVFLLPQVLNPSWFTTTTGAFARLARADYQKADTSALPAADWVENNLRLAGDIYLESRGVNYAVFTASQPVNQCMFLSLFVPHGAGSQDTSLECGWGEPGAGSTISLRIRASGRCEIWKGATLVGDIQISGAPTEVARNVSGRTGQITVASAATPGPGDVKGRFLDLYLMPCRRDTLLIFSSAGGGSNHIFADLDPSVVNTITPAGRFWWHVAAGKASVQCVPMNFATSGYVLGRVIALREAPHGGETFTPIVAADLPGAIGSATITGSVVLSDGTSAFVADGLEYHARLRVDMASDGTKTPGVYAGDAVIGSYIVETDDSEVADLSDFVSSFGFFVSEDPAGTRGEIELRGPRALAAFCAGIGEQSNRPFELYISDDGAVWKPFIFGFVGKPKSIEAAEFRDGSGNVLNDKAFRVVLPWRDRWQMLEELEYEDDVISPDAFVFTDIVTAYPQDAGIQPSEIEVEPDTFAFPYTVGVSRGEWSEKIEKGISIARLLDLWHRDYATSWYMVMRLGHLFVLRSEATLPSAAQTVASLDPLPGEATIRRFEQETIPPEVTRVAVFGYNPSLRVSLRTRLINPLLEDPTTLPSLRPDGWLGTVRPLYVEDPRFTTQDAVNRAATVMLERLSVVRKMAEWNSTLLRGSDGVPLWRGNVVGVVGKGRYRIESFSGTLKNEAVGFLWRDISYVGKRIGNYP
jgi:hypothetical protein